MTLYAKQVRLQNLLPESPHFHEEVEQLLCALISGRTGHGAHYTDGWEKLFEARTPASYECIGTVFYIERQLAEPLRLHWTWHNDGKLKSGNVMIGLKNQSRYTHGGVRHHKMQSRIRNNPDTSLDWRDRFVFDVMGWRDFVSTDRPFSP